VDGTSPGAGAQTVKLYRPLGLPAIAEDLRGDGQVESFYGGQGKGNHGTALRGRMDEPVRGSLRAARTGGLISPEPVTALMAPNGRPANRQPDIPGKDLWTSRRKVSGRKPAPVPVLKSKSSGPALEKRSPEFTR